jgi:hypothetical protein
MPPLALVFGAGPPSAFCKSVWVGWPPGAPPPNCRLRLAAAAPRPGRDLPPAHHLVRPAAAAADTGRAGSRRLRHLAGDEQLAHRLECRLLLARGRLFALGHRIGEHAAIERRRLAIDLLLLREIDGPGQRFDIGAALDEQIDDVDAIERRREDQRRLVPLGLFHVDVGALVEQQRHRFDAAGRGGQMQRRDAAGGDPDRRIRALGEQRLDDAGAAGFGGQMQRRVVADARHRGGIGAGVKQHLGQRGVAASQRPSATPVMPSPSAALTSAPCCSSVFTAVASPRRAAVGHGGRGLLCGHERGADAQRNGEVNE